MNTGLMIQSMLDAVPLPISYKDIEGRYIGCNMGFELQTGWSRAEILGKTVFDIYPNEIATMESASDKEILASGALRTYENIIHTPLEERRLFIVFKTRLLQDNGDVNGLVRVDVDVTEERKAEAERVRQREQLLRADKLASLGKLVAEVAHEINTPTGYITMNSSFISEVWDDVIPILNKHYSDYGDFSLGGLSFSRIKTEIPMVFEDMLQGARRIKKIIMNLKDFVRENSHDQRNDVKVNDVINMALNLTKHTIDKSTKILVLDLADDLPNIRANAQRLEQVLINLITNSCQALRDPNQRVELHSEFDATAKEIRIVVIDEGIGISKDQLSHVFEPFYSSKRREGGTGLGLSISQSIIKEHGGVLDIESEYGKGTTATVRLPMGKKSLGNN